MPSGSSIMSLSLSFYLSASVCLSISTMDSLKLGTSPLKMLLLICLLLCNNHLSSLLD